MKHKRTVLDLNF